MLNFNVPPVKNSTGEPVWKVRTSGTGTGEFYSVQKSSDLQIVTKSSSSFLCYYLYIIFFPVL